MGKGPLLIAMKGPPGAGKSTLARALGRRLGWPLIDKDDVKDVLDGQTPLAGSLAYDVMGRIVRRQLLQGLDVICDSPLLGKAYAGLRRVAEETGSDLVVVECRCGDEATWRHRIESRQRLDLPAHHATSWEKVQAFLRQADVDDPIVGPHLVVDTLRPAPALVDQVLAWLDRLDTAWRADAAP